ILALNAVLHLLLDSAQTKWGNGIHLWAPASWELWNVGWFWPESIPTYAITIVAPLVVAWGWWRGWAAGPALAYRNPTRIAAALALIGVYAAAPIPLRCGPERADNHHVATLRAADRTGLYAEFDRNSYVAGDGIDTLLTFADERLLIPHPVLDRSATASVRATFSGHSTIVIHEIHDHTGWPRNLLSYLGLAVIALVWITPRARRPNR
ncbi:MAG TPA: hypothetical protein VMM17_10585, partial [Gemmatimonadaceae bacterium]|nr:hypothetical protein [Gemmatimonadaceae bacterium]